MRREIIRIENAPYGGHERQRYDLLIPADYEERRGLILFIHGGAWIAGDKEGYRDDMEFWLGKGFAAAAMNYHYIAPGVRMDTLIGDISLALAAIRGKAAAHGIRLERALLTGHSAGGHLSLLYAYSAADAAPIRPACVVDYCGPALLTDGELLYGTPKRYPPEEQWSSLFENLTGIPCDGNAPASEELLAELRRYSPVCYVTPSVPPTVIVHGQKDDVVPFSNAAALRDALEKNGAEYAFLPMPEAGHGLEQRGIYEESRALFEIYARRFLDGETYE